MKTHYLKQELYELIKNSDSIFDFIQEFSLDGLWYWNLEKPEEEWMNPKFWKVLGYNPDEMPHLSSAWQDIIHPEDLKTVTENFHRHLRDPDYPYDQVIRYRHQNGSTVWIRCRGMVIRDEKGNPIRMLGAHHEITDLKNQENKLRKNQERFDQVAKNSRSIIWEIDAEGRFTYLSEMLLPVLGYHPEELVGKACFYDLHPARGRDEFKKKAFEVFERQEAFRDLENPIRKKSGEIIWVNTNGVPVIDDQGKLLGYRGSDRDISELKRAAQERMNLQSQLTQAQKMESVGRLAGGVAHDFNNLLMGLMGYIDLCKSEMNSEDPAQKWLQEMSKSVDRCADLTRQLLAFARKQAIKPQVLNLNDVVGNMLNMLGRLIGEDIELIWSPEEDLGSVEMDPGQVDQILANLCVNARDAIAGVGTLNIKTENSTVDAQMCESLLSEARPGEFVLLSVSDDGCGMDAQTLSKIFEPFFTTKGVGQGTGLGLATVYGITKQNEGFIHVYSEPGKGTTFRIYIPRVKTQPAPPAAARGPRPEMKGTETILLVEDESAVLEALSMILRNLGYTLLVAESPETALDLAGRHTGKIDLLLTDVVMPGMNGKELAEKLLSGKPGIKVLYMSGYPADTITQRGILEKGAKFVSKPFSTATIAQKVREALDAGDASVCG